MKNKEESDRKRASKRGRGLVHTRVSARKTAIVAGERRALYQGNIFSL